MEESLFVLLIVMTGLAGFYGKSLSLSGVVAAVAVGTAVYFGFGANGLVLLGAFFASSSLWSKYKATKKQEMEEKLAKGSRRDWQQVFANGGTAAISALIYSFDQTPQWLLIFAISIASANSDTWASEIGTLSKKNPIDVRSLKRVERGTSGAVSFLGSTAGFFGSLFIASFAGILFSFDLNTTMFVFLFGCLGNLIDTVLGASIQQVYHCPICGLKTEKKHHCGQPAKQIKGNRFVDNDMVNFLSGFLASLLGAAVRRFF